MSSEGNGKKRSLSAAAGRLEPHEVTLPHAASAECASPAVGVSPTEKAGSNGDDSPSNGLKGPNWNMPLSNDVDQRSPTFEFAETGLST